MIPVHTKGIDWEHVGVLGRGVWPNVYNLGDSLIEFSDEGFGFALTDTLGNRSGRVVIRRDDTRLRIRLMYLGNGWFDIVANRFTARYDHYSWPYLYRLSTNDTGFVEERFREIELPEYCSVLDAEPVEGGGYMLLYTYGGNDVWWRVSRVTDEGEVLWTELILDNPPDGGLMKSIGIKQSSTDPSQFYIFSQFCTVPQGPFYAHMTLLDTSGDVQWTRVYGWTDYWANYNIVSMEAFNDGTYGLIGTSLNAVQYLHLSADGDSLRSYTFFTGESGGGHQTKSLLVGGERLLILTDFDNDDRATSGLGLIYINEEGDSIDGCYFHPDTVDVVFPGPMLLRPDGKVMIWVSGGSAIIEQYGRSTDILYTFYPDGRPGAVEEPFEFTPSSLSLSCAPNPLNSMLTIRFTTGGQASLPVRLAIYDLSGRLVADFLSGVTPALRESAFRSLRPETQSLTWDASASPAGVYFVRLQSGADVVTQKVVLMR